MTPVECCRLFLKAWETSSPDEIARLFAEDGVFKNPLQPKPLVGPAEIGSAIAVGLSKLEEIRIEINDAIESGSRACVEGYFYAVRRSDQGRFDFPFSIVLELRDGKIARLVEYFDTAPLRQSPPAGTR